MHILSHRASRIPILDNPDICVDFDQQEDLVEKLRIRMLFLIVTFLYGSTAFAQGTGGNVIQRAARGTLQPAKITTVSGGTIVTKTAPFFSGGALTAARAAFELTAAPPAGLASAGNVPLADLGQGTGTVGCGDRGDKHNQRVNQDCTFRRQAETDITFNP